MTKEEIIFISSEAHPKYISYFEYEDDIFIYTASITEPHDPADWEKSYDDYKFYIGQNWAAPKDGGGYNRVSYIKGNSLEDVKNKLIDEIVKFYFKESE